MEWRVNRQLPFLKGTICQNRAPLLHFLQLVNLADEMTPLSDLNGVERNRSSGRRRRTEREGEGMMERGNHFLTVVIKVLRHSETHKEPRGHKMREMMGAERGQSKKKKKKKWKMWENERGFEARGNRMREGSTKRERVGERDNRYENERGKGRGNCKTLTRKPLRIRRSVSGVKWIQSKADWQDEAAHGRDLSGSKAKDVLRGEIHWAGRGQCMSNSAALQLDGQLTVALTRFLHKDLIQSSH